MEGRQLINGLVQLKGNSLRMVYSFLHQTKPHHLINKQTKEEILRYHRYLEGQANNLIEQNDSGLQLDIWLEMMTLLQVKVTKGVYKENIIQQANRIVNGMVELYNQNSDFMSFKEEHSSNNRINTILLFEIKLQMNRWIEWLKKEKTKDIHLFMQDFQQLMEAQSNEQTKELLKEIDKDTKFGDIIVLFLMNNGLLHYQDILKLIWGHGLRMGLFQGEVDPKLIPSFVLTSPVINGRQVEGIDLRNYLQIEYFKRSLVPIVVLQISILSTNCQSTPSFALISNEWKNRIDNYGQLMLNLKTLEKEKSELEKELESNKMKLKDIYNESKLTRDQIKADKKVIYHALKYTDLTSLDVNLAFEVHRREFITIQQKLNQLLSEKYREGKNNMFSKIKDVISNVGTSIQIQNEKRKLDYYLKEMTEDLLASKSSFKHEERLRIQEAEKRLEELYYWKKQHLEYQKLLKGDLMKVKRSLWKTNKEIKEGEKKHYGLKNTFKHSNNMEVAEKDELS